MKKEHSYYSILFPEKCHCFEEIQPVFFGDLQLDGILKAILSKYMEFDIRKYFYTLPGSAATVLYRQNVYRELEQNPSLVVVLKQYTSLLLESERSFRFYKQMDDKVKKGSYLLQTCQKYINALELLNQKLTDTEVVSEGFSTLKQRLTDLFEDLEFVKFKDTVKQAFSYMETMNLTLVIKKKELRVLDEPCGNQNGIAQQIREFLKVFDIPEENKEKKDDMVKHIFPSPLETSLLENTIVELLQKSRPEIFKVLQDFSDYNFSMDENIFYNLKNEVLFYISFYEFEQQLKQTGHRLEYPQICETAALETEGVYDAALAWKNRFSDYPIVRNDITWKEKKTFLVVTGPNQGGKTTLARAIGQSVYFMQIGLKVPCARMKSRFFEQILTHFEVEESVETGAGKLKEELQRLKPMMQNSGGNITNCFVILNELFTTATTYDARIMAQKVMEHFSRSQCLGIYVTHIQELADENELPQVQSMVAQVDKEDDSIRTFKIVPMEAMGLGYSDSIVKKYELDYEHVAARIANL